MPMTAVCVAVMGLFAGPLPDDPPAPIVVRVAAFDLGGVTTQELKDPAQPRVRRLAAVLQHVRPTVVLLSGIAYDAKGAPGVSEGDGEGKNGQRFADSFLAVQQTGDAAPLKYKAFMGPTNSGEFSGLDLDGDGKISGTFPAVIGKTPSPEAAAFSGDCWGAGDYPGQRGMALLVDERLTILDSNIRTFGLVPWDFIIGSAMPPGKDGKGVWCKPELKEKLRFSSAGHWDVPVKLPNGSLLHVLCSNPAPTTPNTEPGVPIDLRARRNHDEIRFWCDYINNEPYVVDDANLVGGLLMTKAGPIIGRAIPFVIVGNLNSDPRGEGAYHNPVKTQLFTSRHVNATITPESDVKIEGLGASDTCTGKKRLDYVLPTRAVRVISSGVWRHSPVAGEAFPSEHFPVWMEFEVAAPEAEVPEK